MYILSILCQILAFCGILWIFWGKFSNIVKRNKYLYIRGGIELDNLKGIEKFSNKIVKKWIDKKYITQEFEEWYTYGLYSFLSGIVNILIFVALGLLLGCVDKTLVFLATFSLSREFMGGYHCDTPIGCKVSSLIVYAIIMIFAYFNISYNYYILFMIINFIFGNIIIYKICPVIHHNKVLDDKRQKQFKKLSFIVYNLFLLVGFILIQRYVVYGRIINLTLFVVYAMSVVGFYKERKYFK